MPEIFALDTNLYIGALRGDEVRQELGRFLGRVGPRMRLHAVVAMELRAGARTPAQRAAVVSLTAADISRDRVVTPSLDAYVQAGRVIADLAVKERFDAGAAPSFANDVLIATACREVGVTLVTANHGDFTRIGRHLRGFRVAAPWPAG
ncbi:MAG: type II toxin-antitoxin system VapC family toxin [Gemmatimonadaceae bacterium]|nr:type II toxin-antitoxin system VapC family toxin [Gemmatimonadaceae bacterium]